MKQKRGQKPPKERKRTRKSTPKPEPPKKPEPFKLKVDMGK